MAAELKKGEYVFYHCTGHRGKCLEPYTRQEALVNGFAWILGELVIPEEILTGWRTQSTARTKRSRRQDKPRSKPNPQKSNAWLTN